MTVENLISNLKKEDKRLVGLKLVKLFNYPGYSNEEAIKLIIDHYLNREFFKCCDEKILKDFWDLSLKQLLNMNQEVYCIWHKIFGLFPANTSIFLANALLSETSPGALVYENFFQCIQKFPSYNEFVPISLMLDDFFNKESSKVLTPLSLEYYLVKISLLVNCLKHNNFERFDFIFDHICKSLSNSHNIQLLDSECTPEMLMSCSKLLDSPFCNLSFSLIECINLLLCYCLFVKKRNPRILINIEIFSNITSHIFIILPNLQNIAFDIFSRDQCSVNQILFLQKLMNKFNFSFQIDLIKKLFSFLFDYFILSHRNGFEILSDTIFEFITRIPNKQDMDIVVALFVNTITRSLKNIENEESFVNEIVVEYCNRIILRLINCSSFEPFANDFLFSVFETILNFLNSSRNLSRLRSIAVNTFEKYLSHCPNLCLIVLSNLISFDPILQDYISSSIFRKISRINFNPIESLPVKIQKSDKTSFVPKIFGLIAFLMSLGLFSQYEAGIIKYFSTSSKELCASGVKFIYLYPFFVKWIFYRIMIIHDQFQDILLLYLENICSISAKNIDKNSTNLTGLESDLSSIDFLQILFPDNDLKESFTFLYKWVFPMLKSIFTLNSDFEIAINSIVNNLIIPAFRAKSIAWYLILNEIIQYIELQNFIKLWKRDFWDFFMYAFEPNKMQIIDNIVYKLLPLLLKEEKLKIDDLFSTSNFGAISLFTSKENESLVRQHMLKKLSLIIDSSPKDFLISQLPIITSKIQEYVREQDSRSIIYLTVISLLSKVSADYLSSLLPSLIVYIVKIS